MSTNFKYRRPVSERNKRRVEEPYLHIIGRLHGDIKSLAEAPKSFDESQRIGILEIFPQYHEGALKVLLQVRPS